MKRITRIYHLKNKLEKLLIFIGCVLILHNWKITNVERPFSLDNFKLYNVENDLAELYDLKEKETEKYKELINEWVNFSSELKLQFASQESDIDID